jgi:hypothetical protein
MITISFYSFKGGLGRSLTLANLGVYLAQFGATVAMVDFDLEAPGLQYKIRPGERVDVSTHGLAGILADASRGTPVDALDWDIVMDVTEDAVVGDRGSDLLEQSQGRLLLIPAGNSVTPEYWNDLGDIDWYRLFSSAERPGVAVLAQLKQHLEDRFAPDVLLVDSRTGITPGGGVATTLLPDVVVVMMLNSAEHVDGSRLVISAVTESEDPDTPNVVPVLSRYTDPRMGRPRRPSLPGRQQAVSVESEVPLDGLWDALRAGLTEPQAERIDKPLVLHADLILQQSEQLAFGRYAPSGPPGPSQALLDDYLRLFAAVVPEAIFVKHLAGVRNRVRSILLDSPEDAKRTLESLAVLVADEQIFVDLVKLYIVRDDPRGMVAAADRLFQIHGQTMVHPALSEALRQLTDEPGAWRFQDRRISPEFVAAYWRESDRRDIRWGSEVARYVAETGRGKEARDLFHEVTSEADSEELALAVRTMAQGNERAERVASEVALERFESAQDSGAFILAATEACRYRPLPALAQRILGASAAEVLRDLDRAGLLMVAGNQDGAAAVLVESSGALDPDDDSVAQWASQLSRLVQRVPGVRAAVGQRNPTLLANLESSDDERADFE